MMRLRNYSRIINQEQDKKINDICQFLKNLLKQYDSYFFTLAVFAFVLSLFAVLNCSGSVKTIEGIVILKRNGGKYDKYIDKQKKNN